MLDKSQYVYGVLPGDQLDLDSALNIGRTVPHSPCSCLEHECVHGNLAKRIYAFAGSSSIPRCLCSLHSLSLGPRSPFTTALGPQACKCLLYKCRPVHVFPSVVHSGLFPHRSLCLIIKCHRRNGELISVDLFNNIYPFNVFLSPLRYGMKRWHSLCPLGAYVLVRDRL